ncbi:Phospholipase c, partial [Globisporangium splendens]
MRTYTSVFYSRQLDLPPSLAATTAELFAAIIIRKRSSVRSGLWVTCSLPELQAPASTAVRWDFGGACFCGSVAATSDATVVSTEKDTAASERSAQPTSPTPKPAAESDDPIALAFQLQEKKDNQVPPLTSLRRRHSEVWVCEDADIGITNLSAVQGVLCYEISLRFPGIGKLWFVHRTYAEFIALHTSINMAFHKQLHARKIRFPRPARLSWESFRSSSSADDPFARKLMTKLNTYIHKLLEIDEIHSSDTFRTFFTPRPGSLDTESKGKLMPSITIAPTATPLPNQLKWKQKVARLSTSTQQTQHIAPAESLCEHRIHFGNAIQLQALGGLSIALTKRSALSSSEKAVAVAAGVAGVALTGPLSAVFAFGALSGGVGKYHMNKTYYLSVTKPRAVTATNLQRQRSTSSAIDATTVALTVPRAEPGDPNGSFIIENAEMFSGPRRSVKFGDLIHLYCKQVRKSVRIAQPPDSKHGHLMVTNAESNSATLRLVSPYGYTGDIVCGSQVYIQVANGTWDGEYMGLHGEFISSGKSPTVFKICLQDQHECKSCSTEASPEPSSLAVKATSQSVVAQPFKLRVVVYNVWLLPSILSSLNDKISPSASHRARAIPGCLAPLEADVVVFCEAFCSTSRELLVTGMKEQGFLYETKVVGAGASVSTKKAIDGGCFAMSKYPIESFQEMTFGSVASGDDRMADKGVVYCQIRVKNTETVHLFATHLQAWETPGAVATRACQLQLLREYIDTMTIPASDAVLVAGDLNVNKCGNDGLEYGAMLKSLNAVEPELASHSSAFSFDPLTNELAVGGPSSSGETERLDYVLVVDNHRMPHKSSAEVVQLKATSEWQPPRGTEGEKLVDLSDHYPVVGEFHF